jgi:hypothetical protein
VRPPKGSRELRYGRPRPPRCWKLCDVICIQNRAQTGLERTDLSYRLRTSGSASVHVGRRTSAMSRDIIEKPSDKPLAWSRVRLLEADIPPSPLLTRRGRNCPPFRPSREPTDHGLGLVECQPCAVGPAPTQAPPRRFAGTCRRGRAILRTPGKSNRMPLPRSPSTTEVGAREPRS